MNSSSFNVYRYQLLPLDRNSTKDLYNERTTAELIEQKNEIFGQIIEQLGSSLHRTKALIVEVKKASKSIYMLNLAPSRPLQRETLDSKIESVENWPHIYAFVFNLPDEQFLLIQDRFSAFANTDIVVNLFKSMTRIPLDKAGLSIQIESLFDQKYFWGLVEKYRNKITSLEFEFITPNMASISKTLAATLKSLAKDTNSINQELTLKSDPATSLDVSPKNETLKGLVEYASAGGGDIAIKVKGLRKKFHTSKSKREIHLSDIEINGNPEAIRDALKEILK